MNTSRIKRTKTEVLPYFPVINKSRVVTKHFTNLCLSLPADQYCLLNWLVFNCGQDNLIKYRTFLLKRYAATKLELGKLRKLKEFQGTEKSGWYKEIEVHRQNRSLQAIRDTLQALILQGYVLSSGDGNLLLNPNLTYNSHYITKKQYREMSERYQQTTSPDEFISHWLSVNKKVSNS